MSLSTENIYQLLKEVKDPEIPSIDIIELGIVRGIELAADTVTVKITPTYAGCPAMDLIRQEISAVLQSAGVAQIEIETVLSPAWTTDWLSEEAKAKLAQSGIAPPGPADNSLTPLIRLPQKVSCPRCKSANTECTSEFGSTACKSLWRCCDCLEPFEYFKPH